MRRRLLKSWPALTKFYGLMPWDVARLTPDELNEYTKAYSAWVKEQRAAERRANRR